MPPYTAPLLGLFFNRCSGKNVHCTWTLYVDSVRGQWNQHAYTPARHHRATPYPAKVLGQAFVTAAWAFLQSDRPIG